LNIGGSLLNCAKCNALIRGEKGIIGFNTKPISNHMVIFTRGHYRTGYPWYQIPRTALRINSLGLYDLRKHLNAIGSPSSELSQQVLTRLQEAELSDSDEESELKAGLIISGEQI
jgi:hypothetical protein